MAVGIEVRGAVLQALKEAFPAMESAVRAELWACFKDVDPEAWYDAAIYIETMSFLKEHISPPAMLSVGNRLVDLLKSACPPLETKSPREMAHRVTDYYNYFIRGEAAGEWHLESYEPGRAIVVEKAVLSNPFLASGIMRGGLENTGAYNVRIEILSDRAEGAPENRYLVEWIHPSGE